MAIQKINVLEEVANLEQLSQELAKLQRTLRYLLNGNLDFENIRVGGIIADTIDVDQLSAISANLGEITAGIIRGIEIYGSLIATNETGFPRTEMSTTDNYFKVWLNATTFIEIIDQGEEGLPQIVFTRDSQKFRMGHGIHDTPLGVFPGLYANTQFTIAADKLELFSSLLDVVGWDALYSLTEGKTLQQELNEIKSSITALQTQVNGKADKGTSTSTSGSANGGISPGTVLMKYDGSPVTWSGIPSHSHTQN